MQAPLLDAFDDAQRRAIGVMGQVVASLEVGMSERDISELAVRLSTAAGFTGAYHPPEVHVGSRILGGVLARKPSSRAHLEPGSLVSIDLAPANDEVCADIGNTVCFQGEEPEVVSVARDCVRGTAGFASQWKTVGELFVWARAWAVNHRMDLASTRAIGHALLPREGAAAWDWPRGAHRLTRLRRHQIRFLNPRRLQGLWAIRPVVTDGTQGASFEEVVWVDGDDKRVLGRAGLDEVGRFQPALGWGQRRRARPHRRER